MTPLRFALACLVCAAVGHAQASPTTFDIVVRHGTVIDGSGTPRYDADIGIRNGFIAAIGDLAGASAATEIEAKGLFVTPGFINIHSHASSDALPTAVMTEMNAGAGETILRILETRDARRGGDRRDDRRRDALARRLATWRGVDEVSAA